MSRQLTLSAAFAVFASAAFALSTGAPGVAVTSPLGETGATIEAAAPALPQAPALPGLPSLIR